MSSSGSTVVNKTSKFAVFDVKGGEQRSKSGSVIRTPRIFTVLATASQQQAAQTQSTLLRTVHSSWCS